MWIAMSVDYHSMLHYVPVLYGLSVLALVVTAAVGQAAYGSTRWIPLPYGIHLQVSEFVKLVIILLVARYLTDLRSDELEVREMLKLAGLVVVPTALVIKQPDLGTALTYPAILVLVVFWPGCHGYVVAIPYGGGRASERASDYQKARIEVSWIGGTRRGRGTS
jgi:rod shape determining protein RodA